MATSYINTLYHMCIELTSRANSDFEHAYDLSPV